MNLGNFEARSRIESLFNDARTVPESIFYGMAAHIVLLNKLSLGCAGVMVDVIDLQECSRGWFVSLGIHMSVRVQGFPAEYRTVA